jgi:hypothetical protein
MDNIKQLLELLLENQAKAAKQEEMLAKMQASQNENQGMLA